MYARVAPPEAEVPAAWPGSSATEPRDQRDGLPLAHPICAAVRDTFQPFIAIPRDKRSVELATEAASKLCFVVALKTEKREIRRNVVARIFINVMKLKRFTALPTHATCVVGNEHDFRREVSGDRRAGLSHCQFWALT